MYTHTHAHRRTFKRAPAGSPLVCSVSHLLGIPLTLTLTLIITVNSLGTMTHSAAAHTFKSVNSCQFRVLTLGGAVTFYNTVNGV